MISAVVAAALAVIPTSIIPHGVYDCTVEAPRWLVVTEKGAEVRKLNFPNLTPGDWTFRLELAKDVGAIVSPTAKDPLGISGTHGVMTTGDNSYVFASYATSDCIMTDGGCATVVQFVTQADKSLKFLALPSALILLDGAKNPEPFNAIAPGRCVLKGDAR